MHRTTPPRNTGILPVRATPEFPAPRSFACQTNTHGLEARDTWKHLVLLCVLCASAVNAFAVLPPPPKTPLSAEARSELGTAADALAKRIEALEKELKDKPDLLALLPDVRTYHKAVDWPLRYNETIEPKKARAAIKAADDRIAALKAGQAPWLKAGGVRAYVSKIDGSIQPYLLSVPKTYDPAKKDKPYRLDVFYHGRGDFLTELNFISGKVGEAGDSPDAHFTVYPYGRYCNANKFAGEVDTFEILDHVKRTYPIDENRLVVMGFSMGGAAAWHMAVHHTDRWAAASPGAGFAETRVYQKMDASGEWAALPPYRKQLFHLYDATDWARNLSMLPTIAYAGEQDPQRQSGDLMEKAMAEHGLKLERSFGPKTGHKYEPAAKKDLDARLAAYAEKGRNVVPKEIRFDTYTLRYNRMFWVSVDGMGKHWDRARVDGKINDDGSVALTTSNVTRLAIHFPAGRAPRPAGGTMSITIDGSKLDGARINADGSFADLYVRNPAGQWSPPLPKPEQGLRKRHGLQGPIDDAFLDAFLIVKPSQPALNPKLEAWTKHELNQASTEWRKIYRGLAPEKNDHELTDADIRNNNLILFGDPSSNAVIARIADKLPIRWTKDGVVLPGRTFPADKHALIAIYPNPLNPQRYVVLNSGFTFRQADHRTNSRQVAKLPDWAVVDLDTPPNDKTPGAIPAAGFFGEQWEYRADDAAAKRDGEAPSEPR